MRLVPILCLLLLCASGLAAVQAKAETGHDLDKVIEDYWRNEIQEDPFTATSAGVPGHNHRLPAVAPADHARRRKQAQRLLARLDAVDTAGLSSHDRVNRDTLRQVLRSRLALAPFATFRMPFVSDYGFHTAMSYVARSTAMRTAKDYKDYLKRLTALPAYLRQHVDNMRAGLKAGFTQPREILPQAEQSFAALVTDTPEAHPLFEPFTRMPARLSEKQRALLRDKGKRLLKSRVIPAFRDVHRFFVREYMPAARASLGASALPQGRAYYAAMVQKYTGLDDADPEQIHALGLKEVARIRAEMEAIVKEVGFDGSFDDFLTFMRTDPQFYVDAPEQLLKEAAWIAKRVDGKLPAFFARLPRQPYGVEPVPAEIAPNYTTGRYISAPADADKGGYFWINTHALDKRPLFELPALTLHEAVPGHHLQHALALEIEDVPEFRRHLYLSAFGEGWALYAEKLGVEMGIYQTPYEHFGRLTYEMWRACRLVIDTGIHVKGWSRKQARDYLAAHTALSDHNIRTEVDRYVAWPGQALSYKMGELTILELRSKAEAELGKDFDLRAFHDVILSNGAVPLQVLRDEVDRHIADRP